ncbi:hypothetical protein L6Q21_04770 [Sandaracinobacter sp. RS1-74]|uniref:hypothetical protein n=1 Tax=Sandaracinobacteroides sayramensis TaxID=2913411 RepID=UPI001EDC0928|nr:hypothetical protein [Sandaracinobacteroides sayramensis]MCG2840293.1 hypothetical protein [Sandaracinobacteroides sayramensis]
MNMLRICALLTVAALSTGCVTAAKQREVNSALLDVGFTKTDAMCLASRAGRQLSVRQLRSLQRAGAAMEQPVMEMPVGEVLEAIRDNVDTETLSTVARLSAECVRMRLQEVPQ